MRLIPRCYNGNKILDDTIDKISTGLHLSHEAYTHDKKINKVDNAVSNNLSLLNDDTNYQNSDTSRTVKISPKASVTVGTPYISLYGNNRVRISVNPMDNTAVYNDGDNTYGNVNFAHSKENPELSYVTDPTNISLKFLLLTSSLPSSNSDFLNYLQLPNEMRARGISTNALRTSLPGFSNRYFKINSDGEILNIPKRSLLELLTQSLNGNKDVSLSYLDNIFKQGGKI